MLGRRTWKREEGGGGGELSIGPVGLMTIDDTSRMISSRHYPPRFSSRSSPRPYLSRSVPASDNLVAYKTERLAQTVPVRHECRVFSPPHKLALQGGWQRRAGGEKAAQSRIEIPYSTLPHHPIPIPPEIISHCVRLDDYRPSRRSALAERSGREKRKRFEGGGGGTWMGTKSHPAVHKGQVIGGMNT